MPDTMTDEARDALAMRFGAIACEAGTIVMTSARTAALKSDGSPVTEADRASEALIRARLQAIDASLAIVAEESFDAAHAPAAPHRFILIDPLDGTREFAGGGNEFTINIALIENGDPVVGVVYAPAFNRLYLGGASAWRADVAPGGTIGDLLPIATSAYPPGGLRALVSRSHLDSDTQAMLDALAVHSRTAMGSSLKFGLLAQGDADLYPRLAPTMEWDTAAGHAVVVAAGGCVLGGDGRPLRYGKPGYRSPSFFAWGRQPVGS